MLVRRASTYCNPLLAHSLLPLIGQGNNLPFAHRRKVFFLFIKGKLPFDSLTIWFNSFPMLVHAFIIHYAFCEKRRKDIFWRPTTHDTATKIAHQKFGTYIIAWTVLKFLKTSRVPPGLKRWKPAFQQIVLPPSYHRGFYHPPPPALSFEKLKVPSFQIPDPCSKPIWPMLNES